MAVRRYQNFDLSLEAAGDGSFWARVAYCPLGEFSPVLFSLTFEGTELDYLMLKLDPGRSGTRRSGVTRGGKPGPNWAESCSTPCSATT